MATFDELVQQVNDNLDKNRDRGTVFEKMVVAYLKNEPLYKRKFKNVWMLNEVPDEYGVPKKDLGVDVVAEDYNGNLTAVQAKLLAVISNIEEQGLAIAERQKWAKKLASNLYEIRSKRASNIQRAIYFHWENNKYVITHGFTKKTQKTPRREIKKGIQRRDNFERRHRNE